jgi:TatD DNase family protein
MGEGGAFVGAIDTHTHLNHPRLLRRLKEVLARAKKAGVSEMIVVGWDVASSERAVELAGRFAPLWAAVGVHPHDAAHCDGEALRRLRALAKSDKVVAIGETGLDFYRDLSPRDVQKTAFRQQLALARDLDLPAIIHCRAAEDAVLEVLETAGPARVVWHCFDGSPEVAGAAVAMGAWLGFAGRVTHRGAGELRKVAKATPRDRILLETDCPYLMPEPRRGRDNEPANLRHIAGCIARVRGEMVEQVVAASSTNARCVFGMHEGDRQHVSRGA